MAFILHTYVVVLVAPHQLNFVTKFIGNTNITEGQDSGIELISPTATFTS
jgi:hypothetical protein